MPDSTHVVTRWRTTLEAIVTGLLTAAMAIPVFGPVLSKLDVAWSGGDLTSTYADSIAWGGFAYRLTTHFGFPLGMNLNYFPGIDVTENLFAWLTNNVLHTTFAGINLLILVSFPLVAVLAYLTLRLTGLYGPIAVAMAIAFTFIPYHFGRALGHTFLATLYSMVVGLALVLIIGSGRWQWMLRRKHSWFGILIVIAMTMVVAWSGIYYVAFTLILGFAALLWRIGQRASVRALIVDALPLITILVLALLAFLPSILTLRHSPPLASLGDRLPIESVTYAGVLAMALLPLPWSQIPGLSHYNEKVSTAIAAGPYGESTAATNYGTWITSLAVVVIVIALMVRARRGTREFTYGAPRASLQFITYLIVVTILFLVPWGLNYIFAGTVTAQIRGWNRLVPVLLLLFLVGAAAALHRTGAARRLVASLPIAVVVLALVLVDSVLPFRATYADGARLGGEQTQAARDYAAATNAAIPQHCGVLQLPYMAYPENGNTRAIPDYDNFYASLTNPGKDFSYGSVKYTPASIWASQLPQVPTDEQVALLRGAGFCAISVDFRGYLGEQTTPIFDDLSTRFGSPVASGLDDSWQLFRIPDGPMPTADQVQAFLHQPFIESDPATSSAMDSSLESMWWWTTQRSSTFTLTATAPDHPVTTVTGALQAPSCGPVPITLTLTGATGVTQTMNVIAKPDGPTPFRITTPATPEATLQVNTPGRGYAVDGVPGVQQYVQVRDLAAR